MFSESLLFLTLSLLKDADIETTSFRKDNIHPYAIYKDIICNKMLKEGLDIFPSYLYFFNGNFHIG